MCYVCKVACARERDNDIQKYRRKEVKREIEREGKRVKECRVSE